MFPRNSASPPTVAVGSIYLIADGTIQTSGASVRVRTAGGAWGAGAGTLAYDATSGAIEYTPSQGETNGAWFMVAVYKSSCTTACVTVVTTAAATAGQTVPEDGAITAAKLGADCITAAKIADDAIAAEHLATGALTADAFAANALVAATFAASSLDGKGNWNTTTPPTAAAIRTEIDSNSTQLALIVADTSELQTNQGNWLTATGFAEAGDAMTLTAGERTTLAAAIEAAIINELDGTAVMQAIADLIADDMTTGDLTVQAIASAVRDAILDRVLSGNHDDAGSTGKLIQNLDATVSSRSSHSAADVEALILDESTPLDVSQLNSLMTAIGVVETKLPGSLIGGRMDCSIGAVHGDTTAAQNMENAYDGTGYNVGGGQIVAASVTDKTGFSLAADQSGVTIGTVTLVTTCTTNTDMRGTDSAALATSLTTTDAVVDASKAILDKLDDMIEEVP